MEQPRQQWINSLGGGVMLARGVTVIQRRKRSENAGSLFNEEACAHGRGAGALARDPHAWFKTTTKKFARTVCTYCTSHLLIHVASTKTRR